MKININLIMSLDVRWHQRLAIFVLVLMELTEAIELAQQRQLRKLHQIKYSAE